MPSLCVRPSRVALPELGGQQVLGRIGADHGDAPHGPLRFEHVDHAPVGQLRHGELRNALEGELVVERGRQRRARLRQEHELLAGLLLGPVQAGIGDGDRGTAGDLLGEREVGRHVVVPRAAPGERDRTQSLSVRDQGNRDRRARRELGHEPQVLVVTHRLGQRLRRELVEDHRRAVAERPRRRLGRIPRRRVAAPEILEQLLVVRIGGGDRHPTDRPLPLDHVDDAPVCERGHREPGDVAERRFPVERVPEQGTRLGEEAEALLGPPLRRDVAEDADRPGEAAVDIPDRHRPHRRPALGPGVEHTKAEQTLDRLEAGEHEPAGQLLGGNGAPVLVADLEAIADAGERRGEQLVRAVPAERPGGLLVGVDEGAGQILQHDSRVEAGEDGDELIALAGADRAPLEDRDRAGNASVGNPQRRAGRPACDCTAGPGSDLEPPLPALPGERGVQRRAGRLGQQLSQVAAEHVATRPPEGALRLGVPVGDRTLRIDRDDGGPELIQEHARQPGQLERRPAPGPRKVRLATHAGLGAGTGTDPSIAIPDRVRRRTGRSAAGNPLCRTGDT